MKRGLYLALLLCGVAGVLLLVGASSTWASLVEPARAPLPDRRVLLLGHDLVPGLRALGVLALAAVPALLSVRRLGRVVVGVLVLAAGVLGVVLVARVLADPTGSGYGSEAYRTAVGGSVVHGLTLDDSLPTAGVPRLGLAPCTALFGSVLLVLAGLSTVVRGRSWPALGARYEAPSARPAAAPEVTDRSTWDALDRGEDPTAAEPSDRP